MNLSARRYKLFSEFDQALEKAKMTGQSIDEMIPDIIDRYLSDVDARPLVTEYVEWNGQRTKEIEAGDVRLAWYIKSCNGAMKMSFYMLRQAIYAEAVILKRTLGDYTLEDLFVASVQVYKMFVRKNVHVEGQKSRWSVVDGEPTILTPRTIFNYAETAYDNLAHKTDDWTYRPGLIFDPRNKNANYRMKKPEMTQEEFMSLVDMSMTEKVNEQRFSEKTGMTPRMFRYLVKKYGVKFKRVKRLSWKDAIEDEEWALPARKIERMLKSGRLQAKNLAWVSIPSYATICCTKTKKMKELGLKSNNETEDGQE